jgi:hypothetical protein
LAADHVQRIDHMGFESQHPALKYRKNPDGPGADNDDIGVDWIGHVFVALAATPWVFRREGERFISHTGQPAGAVHSIFLDAEGNVLLATALGIGLLDDRELAGFLADCQGADGQPASEEAFVELLNGGASSISWNAHRLEYIQAGDLPQRFGFDPAPKP